MANPGLSTVPTTKIDIKLVNRLRGRILLQVESRGEAWYVDPGTGSKTYLPNGTAAFSLLRSAGLGISNADLQKIPIEGSSSKGDVGLVRRLAGRILLQVQARGEAWYVNPVNGKRYYLRNGDEAYRIMQKLGLGIKNSEVGKIPTRVGTTP